MIPCYTKICTFNYKMLLLSLLVSFNWIYNKLIIISNVTLTFISFVLIPIIDGK